MQSSPFPRPFPSAALSILAAGAVFLTSLPAAAAVGAWVEGAKARIRLVGERADPAGALSAAIEIELPPGWKTYWRSPGDAGIAPVADFSGSTNVGPVEVSFPVPARADDGYTVTNVYTVDAVLPLAAPVTDASAPSHLAVKLDIGVCEEVCVPDHFEAGLDVPPGNDAAAAKIIAEAKTKLPGPPEPGIFAVDAIVRNGGTDKRPAFDIKAIVPDSATAFVFAEGPPDWFPDVPKLIATEDGKAVYRVTFDRLTAKTPLAGASLRVTIASGARAIEQTVKLD